jgi:hypothetical protein
MVTAVRASTVTGFVVFTVVNNHIVVFYVGASVSKERVKSFFTLISNLKMEV